MKYARAYKIRLYPNKAQEEQLVKVFGATRFVWNHFLDKRVKHYEKTGKTLGYAEMSRDLTQMRHKEEWMQEVNADVLGASLRRLDTAYKRFFKLKRGFPAFKTKKQPKQSFQKKNQWRIEGKKVVVLGMAIRFRGTIDPKMPKRMIIVSRVPSGKWYLSALYEKEIKAVKKFSKPIGIDLGLTHLAITSEGRKYMTVPKVSTAGIQKAIARGITGSTRNGKLKAELTKIHERIANIRRDHTHKVSTGIVAKNHGAIVVEDLNVGGMMQNHRLAGSIANVNWNELLRQIEYKQIAKGGKFIKIDRFFASSKTCSNCGFIRDSLPLNIREWRCDKCKVKLDRDVNAAKNILKEGLRISPARRTQVRRSANVSQ